MKAVYKMKAKFNRWNEEISLFAKKNNSNVTLRKHQSIGYGVDYYHIEVIIKKAPMK